MTNLHKDGEPGVESQGRPPADGGQQPRETPVPPVGTLPTQEGPAANSGATGTGTRRLIDWVSKNYPTPTFTLGRVITGCRPTPEQPYGCPLPNPKTHKRNAFTCDACQTEWRRNPIVSEWYRGAEL